MLQRILGSHPDIHTMSEPWLMLSPLYNLHRRGYEAEYDASLAQIALQDFLQNLPEGEKAYLEGVRRMYGFLYGRALEESGKKYFLDKTPRYYLIISELYRTFPDAQFIFLFRNPLAVLWSIIRTRIQENWLCISRFENDLLRAPKLLTDGVRILGKQGVVVHYEALVKDANKEVRKICDSLEIEFAPDMIEYGGSDIPRWSFGDRSEVYNQKQPVSANIEKWIQALDDPQVWKLMNDYLEILGDDMTKRMDYSYNELQHTLETNRPSNPQLWLTSSLDWLLKKSKGNPTWWNRSKVSILRSLQVQGFWKTIFMSFSSPALKTRRLLVRHFRAIWEETSEENNS